MEPLFDKLARHKRQIAWFILSLLIAILLYFLQGFLALSEDDMKPHPRLDAVLSVMGFPASLLPGFESYDSETATMPMETWQWFSELGFALNSLLWGLFVVWVFRVAVRLFVSRNETSRTISPTPADALPPSPRLSRIGGHRTQILSCGIVASLLLVFWAGVSLVFDAGNHGVIEIENAVRGGDLAKVTKLLKENPTLVSRKNSDDRTPLHWALIANGVDYDYRGMVALLLINGADVNARDKTDWTPLELAAQGGYGDAARLLVAHGADINAKDDNGATPLDYAAANGCADVVRLLLAHGADASDSDNDGRTPLDYAAEDGQTDAARILLRHGAKLNVYDAAALGCLQQLKSLLKDHPDLVFRKDRDERTPLHWAAITDEKEAVALLLARRADVNARDDEGWTPLEFAALHDNEGVAELLLANKADVNVRDNEGKTCLHWAAANGHQDIVDLLLANKANVNAKDQSGETPLLAAAGAGYTNVAELLRRHGGRE